MIKKLVNLPISIFNHIFNVPVMNDAYRLIITTVYLVNNRFVSLKEGVVEDIQHFDLFERHFHDYFYFEPESSNCFEVLFSFILLVVEKHIVEDDPSDFSRKSNFLLLILTFFE